MGRRMKKEPGAGMLSLLLAAALMTAAGCINPLSEKVEEDEKRVGAEAILGAPAVNVPAGSDMTAHERLVLLFAESIDTGTLKLGGDLAAVAEVAWSQTSFADDTLTLDPAAGQLWPEGSGQTLTVSCTADSGKSLSGHILSYTVFRGVCVSSSIDPDNPGNPATPGTRDLPLSVVQDGIDEAAGLYIQSAGDAAEVRVADGTFQVACNTGTPLYAADMVEGVDLKGGYDSNFTVRNPGSYVTLLEDTSSSGGGETTPVCLVYCDSSITTATEISGLTLLIGKGAGGGEAHCGIYCDQGNPTILEVTVQGRSGTEAGLFAEGLLLRGSAAAISGCSVDPGESKGESSGIYCIQGSAPSISGCTISGGSGINTYAVRVENSSAGTITGSTLNGGSWNTGSGSGYCLRVYNSTPAVSGNTFAYASSLHWQTYGVYEATADSDPALVRDNHFAYDGYWYYDEAADLVQKTNYDTPVSTGEGTAELFDPAGWNNTAVGVP